MGKKPKTYYQADGRDDPPPADSAARLTARAKELHGSPSKLSRQLTQTGGNKFFANFVEGDPVRKLRHAVLIANALQMSIGDLVRLLGHVCDIDEHARPVPTAPLIGTVGPDSRVVAAPAPHRQLVAPPSDAALSAVRVETVGLQFHGAILFYDPAPLVVPAVSNSLHVIELIEGAAAVGYFERTERDVCNVVLLNGQALRQKLYRHAFPVVWVKMV